MDFIFYILILIPLFFIAFFAGFMGYKTTQKADKKRITNYYFKQNENQNSDLADFLNYDGSNKKGDN